MENPNDVVASSQSWEFLLANKIAFSILTGLSLSPLISVVDKPSHKRKRTGSNPVGGIP